MGQLTDSALPAVKIGQCRKLVIGSPAYFKAMGMPQTHADLSRHRAVIYYEHRGGGEDWTFRRETVETSVTVPGRVRMSAIVGVRAGVLAGMGLTVASEWTFAPELQ